MLHRYPTARRFLILSCFGAWLMLLPNLAAAQNGGLGPFINPCEASLLSKRPPIDQWGLKDEVVMWDREMFFLPDGRLIIVGLANHRSLNIPPQSGDFGNLRDVNTIFWFFEGGHLNQQGDLEIYPEPKSIKPFEVDSRFGYSTWTPAGRYIRSSQVGDAIELMIPVVDFNKGTKQVFYRAIFDMNFDLQSYDLADPVYYARARNNPKADTYRPFDRHGKFPELNRDGKWVAQQDGVRESEGFYFAVRVMHEGKLRSAVGVSPFGIENLSDPLIPVGPNVDPDKYDEFEVPSPVFYKGELYLFTSATRTVILENGKESVDRFIIGYRRDAGGVWHPVHENSEVISGPNQYYAAKFVPLPGQSGRFATIAFKTEPNNLDVQPTSIGISYFDAEGKFHFAY